MVTTMPERHVTMRRHDAASHCDVTVRRHGPTYERTYGLTEMSRDGRKKILLFATAREKSLILRDDSRTNELRSAVASPLAHPESR